MSATETKQAHTPGPWEVHVGHDVTGYPCFFIHGFAGDAKRDLPTLEADIRLIAAAPEILEALEAINDSAMDGREIPEWLEERLVAVQSAIRSAKGEL